MDIVVKWVAIVAIVVVIIVAGATYIVIANPFTAPRFEATLSLMGSGSTLTSLVDGHTFSVPYANVSMVLTSPSVLDPSKLNIIITKPGATLTSAGSRQTSSGIDLVYSYSAYPHWQAALGGSRWSGYTADAFNPDGSLVGGPPTSVVQNDTLRSGVTFTLTFPVNSSSIAGFEVTVQYRGVSGNATVQVEP